MMFMNSRGVNQHDCPQTIRFFSRSPVFCTALHEDLRASLDQGPSEYTELRCALSLRFHVCICDTRKLFYGREKIEKGNGFRGHDSGLCTFPPPTVWRFSRAPLD